MEKILCFIQGAKFCVYRDRYLCLMDFYGCFFLCALCNQIISAFLCHPVRVRKICGYFCVFAGQLFLRNIKLTFCLVKTICFIRCISILLWHRFASDCKKISLAGRRYCNFLNIHCCNGKIFKKDFQKFPVCEGEIRLWYAKEAYQYDQHRYTRRSM